MKWINAWYIAHYQLCHLIFNKDIQAIPWEVSLTPSTLGKNFSEWALIFHANCFLWSGDTFHEIIKAYFLGKKNINLSSAELAQTVVKVKDLYDENGLGLDQATYRRIISYFPVSNSSVTVNALIRLRYTFEVHLLMARRYVNIYNYAI